MFFIFAALAITIVATVVFSVIGENTPPARMPEYEPSDRGEAERARYKRKQASKNFEEKRKRDSESSVTNMTPAPQPVKKKREEPEEELEEQEQKKDNKKVINKPQNIFRK